MKFIFHQNNEDNVTEVISDEILISKVRDALDLMANVDYQGSQKIILHEKNISHEFFSLKTGIAGEILQKFVNYHKKLAIVGDFSKYNKKSFKDFIGECNRGNQLFFLADVKSALEKLHNSKESYYF